jgi:hypothetical protein
VNYNDILMSDDPGSQSGLSVCSFPADDCLQSTEREPLSIKFRDCVVEPRAVKPVSELYGQRLHNLHAMLLSA